MVRGQRGWQKVPAVLRSAALALWLAIAVPVACHHASAQPLFLVATHDHDALGRHGHAHATLLPEPVIVPQDASCAVCFAPSLPHVVSELAVPAALLPPVLPLGWPQAVRYTSALGLPAPPRLILPQHEPPPRLTLPASVV